MKEIAFIFPPFSESALHGPHLAIPLLSAILREVDVETVSYDLNIKTVRRVIEREFLEEAQSVIEASSATSEEVEHALAAIQSLTSTSLEVFLNGNPLALRNALAAIRPFVFPIPQELQLCLVSHQDRPTVASQLYYGFIKEILSRSPRAICFSVAFSEQLPEAIELAKLFKASSPETSIWLGGSQVNLLEITQISALESSNLFDLISIGNGEKTIQQFALQTDQEKKRGVLHSGPMARGDLNKLPVPLFEGLNQYFHPVSLPVLVTKGCYWGKCTFCDYPRLSDIGDKRYIDRDPETVINEIAHLRNIHTFDDVNLISDAIPPGWYKRLADLAISRQIPLRTWSYMMHHNSLGSDYYEHLANAGVKAINFGTESCIDRILDVMKKQANYEGIRANLTAASNAGITTVSNAIPDYPTTTSIEAYENVNRFESLLPFIDSLNPQSFDLTAGTPIQAQPELFGITITKDAYIKTNHGYHGVVYDSRDPLSATDRNIVNRAFLGMKWRTLLRRRSTKVDFDSLRIADVLVFDGSARFLNPYQNILWLISIGYKWEVTEWERPILEEIIATPNREVRFDDLSRLYTKYSTIGSDYWIKWIESLSLSGLIVGLRHQSQVYLNYHPH
ncbi:MAG: hypothetical protein FJ264_04435 [Planctomycetes bacterium]|nr:hypothetical protein [Planctomycetota bacterium]